jgi:hypothetical protein
MNFKQIDIFSDLIALDVGIVHPTVALATAEECPRSIDEALASLSAKESRACKRKFRKLLRSCKRKSKFSGRWSARKGRAEVLLKIRVQAWNVIRSADNQQPDNDE